MKMLQKSLLLCGVLASVLYVGVDVLAAIRYPEYHSFSSRVVSELMAKGAPTERLVDPLFLLYGALMMAFGVGVWMSERGRRMHIVGALLFVYAAIGLLGPTVAEMNLRGSGGDPAADVRHAALTGVIVLFIFGSVGFAASIGGRLFRLYSFATMLIMVVFGILTALMMRNVSIGKPTPWVGAMERINIGAFLIWVVVFAILLLYVRDNEPGGYPFPGREVRRGALSAR